MKQHSPKAIRG